MYNVAVAACWQAHRHVYGPVHAVELKVLDIFLGLPLVAPTHPLVGVNKLIPMKYAFVLDGGELSTRAHVTELDQKAIFRCHPVALP